MSDLDVARRQEIRYQLLWLLDSDRPDSVDTAILLRGLKVPASPDDIGRELAYLESRKLVAIAKAGGRAQAALLAAGVDLLEGNNPQLAGLIRGDRLSQVEIERRKVLRWIVLRLADRSRPIPLQEALAQRALHDVSFVVSEREIRRLITYLEQSSLLQVERRHADAWTFTPTADGVDVCEFTRDCPPGVGRPEQYH